MMSETSMIGNNEIRSHYLNGKIPDEIAENLKEFFPEHGDLSFEEVLLQQVFSLSIVSFVKRV